MSGSDSASSIYAESGVDRNYLSIVVIFFRFVQFSKGKREREKEKVERREKRDINIGEIFMKRRQLWLATAKYMFYIIFYDTSLIPYDT